MKTLLLLGILVASQFVSIQDAKAAEPVARLTICSTGGAGFNWYFVANYQGCNPAVNYTPPMVQALMNETFKVYTTGEVDSTVAEIKKRHDDLVSDVDSKLLAAETRLHRDVVNTIDGLPPKILADTAGQAIKTEILRQLREDMAQMRKDLQTQIDELRAALPNAK